MRRSGSIWACLAGAVLLAGCGSSSPPMAGDVQPILKTGAPSETAAPKAEPAAAKPEVPVVAATPTPAALPLVAGRRPAVILSVPSIEKMLAELTVMGELTGQGPLAAQLERGYTPILGELDRTRSAGVYWLVDERDDEFVAFLPLKSGDGFRSLLVRAFGPVEEQSDGVLKFTSFAYKEVGTWGYLAAKPEDLKGLLDDPTVLRKDMNAAHTFTVRIDPDGFSPWIKRKEAEDAKHRVERELTGPVDPVTTSFLFYMWQIAMTNEVATGAHVMDVGWNLTKDRNKTRAALDIKIVPKPGTPLATRLATSLPKQLPLAGFQFDDASLFYRRYGVVTDFDRQFSAKFYEQIKGDLQKEFPILGQLPEERAASLARLDSQKALYDLVFGDEFLEHAMVTTGDSEGRREHATVIGLAGSKHRPMDDALEDLLTDLKRQGVTVDPGEEVVQGVKLRKVRLRISSKLPGEWGETIQKLWGGSTHFTVGSAPGRIYLASGTNADALLRRVLDGAQTKPNTPAESLKLRLTSVELASLLRRYEIAQVRSPSEYPLSEDVVTVVAHTTPGAWTMRADFSPGAVQIGSELARRVLPDPNTFSSFWRPDLNGFLHRPGRYRGRFNYRGPYDYRSPFGRPIPVAERRAVVMPLGAKDRLGKCAIDAELKEQSGRYAVLTQTGRRSGRRPVGFLGVRRLVTPSRCVVDANPRLLPPAQRCQT